MFLCGLLSLSINWGGQVIKKCPPQSNRSLSLLTSQWRFLFIERLLSSGCWYLWMDDLSSANMRLLTLVMTTLGQAYHRGGLSLFSYGATQIPVPLRLSLGIHLCQDCCSEQAAEIRAETLHAHFRSITLGPAPVLLHLWGFREWLQAAPWFYYKVVIPSLSLRSHHLLWGKDLRVRESSSCPWMKPGIIQPVPVCPSPWLLTHLHFETGAELCWVPSLFKAKEMDVRKL